MDEHKASEHSVAADEHAVDESHCEESCFCANCPSVLLRVLGSRRREAAAVGAENNEIHPRVPAAVGSLSPCIGGIQQIQSGQGQPCHDVPIFICADLEDEVISV